MNNMASLTLEEMIKFDDVFLGILQHCGKIEPFLDAIFYFLSRRTDFFQLMHSKDDKLGFPPGVAEKMLIKIFQKHQDKVLENDPIYMKWKNKNKTKNGGDVPEPIKEVEVRTEDVSLDSSKSEVTSVVPSSKTEEPQKKQSEKKEKAPPTKKEVSSATASKLNSSDTFNGGETDLYSWSQTLNDVDVKIPVPACIKKSKELSIEIRTDSLSVKLRNDPPADSDWKDRVLMDGTLSNKVRCEESLWSLLPGQYISINLEKIEPKWWTRVLETDKEIDKQSIDTTQHVQDFDEQTQADIRKVMYDQQQKMMGKPTSEEQKTHDLLKKAWDAEGSPFKGTPFDPSKVNIGGGNGGGGFMGGGDGGIN